MKGRFTPLRLEAGARLDRLALEQRHGPILGFGRTLLALSLLLTLTFNDYQTLFSPAVGLEDRCNRLDGIVSWSTFCQFEGELGRAVAIGVLLLVCIGWRPALTAIPHAWIAVSFATTASIPDGGDQIAGVLTAILVPALLVDRRTWHWQESRHCLTGWHMHASLVAVASLVLMRLQVATIYLQAAISKLGVEEWANGTVMYYWVNDAIFGPSGVVGAIARSIVINPWGVALLTWVPIAIEFCLALTPFMSQRGRQIGLLTGIFFHTIIALLFGLVTFAMVMTGALVLSNLSWAAGVRILRVRLAQDVVRGGLTSPARTAISYGDT